MATFITTHHQQQQHHFYAFDAATVLEQLLNELQLLIDECEIQFCRHKPITVLYDIKETLLNAERHLLCYFQVVLKSEQQKQQASSSPLSSSSGKAASTANPSSASSNASTSSLSSASSSTSLTELYQRASVCSDLKSSVELLRSILNKSQQQQLDHETTDTDGTRNNTNNTKSHRYYRHRSTTDSLLFRLHVALQLCRTRIDDASLGLTGRRCRRSSSEKNQIATSGVFFANSSTLTSSKLGCGFVLAACTITASMYSSSKTTTATSTNRFTSAIRSHLSLSPTTKFLGSMLQGMLYVPKQRKKTDALVAMPSMLTTAKAIASFYGLRWFNKKWTLLWITSKLTRSIDEIEEWICQWSLVQRTTTHISAYDNNSNTNNNSVTPPINKQHPTYHGNNRELTTEVVAPPIAIERTASYDFSLEAARSKRLIEYSLHETPKSSVWQSKGELRFLMLKRAMDVFYASVDTALDLTTSTTIEQNHRGGGGGDGRTEEKTNHWQLTFATAAAASFYSLTGARDRAAVATSSSESARDLIRNAWGMVSLPAIKSLSLNASKLLKGAAVADRIEICGVHCFVLSSDPSPELAAAVSRQRRLHQRRKPIKTLSRIDETEEDVEQQHTNNSCSTPILRNASCSAQPFALSSSTNRYRQRDVIFHLTGGGFFAHIIASDLPYLLDWSASTGAVVICPEYALLPEHRFPQALYQIEDVYQALVSNDAVSTLGFETNHVIVTGESAGGNLAAALCVKICMDQQGIRTSLSDEEDKQDYVGVDGMSETNNNSSISSLDEQQSASGMCNQRVRMPDALMLSCPVLDLSLEMSQSRVIGTEDPVLPSGLISAISDEYLPPQLGISKKDPLASPFYASDEVLQQFPPTLLFASSNDPLLDDSVVFNQRLRSFSVESDLIAAHNLPHAYLGLGTAGFPEARQVQQQCVDWLQQQLSRTRGSDVTTAEKNQS